MLGDRHVYWKRFRLRVWETETWQLAYTQKHAQIGEPCFSDDGRLLALPGSIDKGLTVIEVATGGEVRRVDGVSWAVTATAFTQDGRALAVADSNSTILVYDMTGRTKDAALPERPFTPDTLAARWGDLTGPDAGKAFDAQWALASSPKEVTPFLAKKLTPVPAADGERVDSLLRDLDSDDFGTRESAYARLQELRDTAVPALQRTLARSRSIEVKRRIEQLVKERAAAEVASLRALKVLEAIGTPAAQEQLRALARGATAARLTVEAHAALRRLRLSCPGP